MGARYLTIAGAGLCLPGATDLAGLGEHLVRRHRPVPVTRRLAVPDTDLAIDAAVADCCPPGSMPAPWASGRRLPAESRLAVWVAARVNSVTGGAGPASTGAATVWVSSTAGMAQYGQVCAEAATLDPGLASPLAGPQSAYNGPATAVSIALGLAGPQVVLTGDRDAGLSAVVEAGRLLDEGRCDRVLVGGSATVDAWRLAGAGTVSGSGVLPADGALCLLLSQDPGPAGSPPNGCPPAAIGLRPLRRTRLRLSSLDSGLREFVVECRESLRGSPAALVVSAGAESYSRAEPALGTGFAARWHVEHHLGDLAAAGGLQAVLAAAALCRRADGPGSPPAAALVLALGDRGEAAALEVVSRKER